MSELIAISALIGDRTFRIKIEPKDEEVVRKTLKTINDKILEFKSRFETSAATVARPAQCPAVRIRRLSPEIRKADQPEVAGE